MHWLRRCPPTRSCFPGMRASSLPGENGAALLPMAAQGCRRILVPELLDAVHPADIKCAPTCAKGASQVAQWKEPACQRRRHGIDPWVGKIPWRRKWQPTPAFLPGESHGQRSLTAPIHGVAKDSDTTEHAHTYARVYICARNWAEPRGSWVINTGCSSSCRLAGLWLWILSRSFSPPVSVRHKKPMRKVG